MSFRFASVHFFVFPVLCAGSLEATGRFTVVAGRIIYVHPKQAGPFLVPC